MINEELITNFAPSGRFESESVKEQSLEIISSKEFQKLTDALPNIFLILNSARQIIYANKRIIEYLKINTTDDLLGKRPGEAFNCIHSYENAAGCGTSIHCSMCGAVNAIMDSMKGLFSIKECRILTDDGLDALDLRVWASPYKFNEDSYTIFAVEDISNEKRRGALERIFFHDILNTANGLRGLSEVLKDSPEDINEFKDIIFSLSESLIDEIQAQKQLLAAEKEELALNLSIIQSTDILSSITAFYHNHYVSDGKYIVIDTNSETVEFSTDEALLKRVIGNMLKNALEGSKFGDTITLKSFKTNDEISFSVNNPIVCLWRHNYNYLKGLIQPKV